MGRKKKNAKKRKDREEMMFDDEAIAEAARHHRRDAKMTAKMKKKLRKRLAQETLKSIGGKNQSRPAHTWHNVTVHGSSAMDKEFILTSIGNDVENKFQPLGYYTMTDMCGFYLENNEEAADSIASLNMRLQGSDGKRLKINVKKCSVPDLVLNSNQLQLLREVLSTRYNVEACLLDLSELHTDARLLAQDILAPITSPSVMKQVLRTIREHVPNIKALNLSKNNLSAQRVGDLKSLHTEESQLSAINLEHNNIETLTILKFIKMFPLTELKLQFNPLMKKFLSNPLRYIESVKKEVPTLKIIDNVNIEEFLQENKQIESVESSKEPVNNAASSDTVSSSSATVPEQMVRNFLEQYYALIDTPNRHNLVAAYTPEAVFEVKSSVGGIGSNVFVGQGQILEALRALPATQHQHNTFSFKIEAGSGSAQVLVSGQMQIAGCTAVVAFARKMNIVPFNAGFCCSQDLLEMKTL